jgi:hypothetical protein
MPGALLGPFGRYELGTEIVTIGRSSTNKLVINDGLVSGRHLQVVPRGAEYLLIDVGSSNGTRLNGQRLTPQTPQPLLNGDIIMIGNTTLTVELTPAAFPAAPGLGPQGEIIATPPQQPGIFPPANTDAAFPPYAPPGPAAPNFGGPAPQGMPLPPAAPGSPFSSAAPAQPGWPLPSAAPPPQDAPLPSAAPAPQGPPFLPAESTPQGWPVPPTQQTPNQFGVYPGSAPGQPPAYQPGFGAPLGAPPYGGAGGAFPPARPRARRNRTLVLIGALVALVLILGAGAVIFLKFPGSRSTAQGTPTPGVAQQVIMPFYEDLKNQDFKAAASLFTTRYLNTFGGVDAVANNLKTISDTLGRVISYSIMPPSGSSQSQTAKVQVKRAPVPPATTAKTFNPDIVELAFEASKQIWQIDNWMPGQPKS